MTSLREPLIKTSTIDDDPPPWPIEGDVVLYQGDVGNRPCKAVVSSAVDEQGEVEIDGTFEKKKQKRRVHVDRLVPQPHATLTRNNKKWGADKNCCQMCRHQRFMPLLFATFIITLFFAIIILVENIIIQRKKNSGHDVSEDSLVPVSVSWLSMSATFVDTFLLFLLVKHAPDELMLEDYLNFLVWVVLPCRKGLRLVLRCVRKLFHSCLRSLCGWESCLDGCCSEATDGYDDGMEYSRRLANLSALDVIDHHRGKAGDGRRSESSAGRPSSGMSNPPRHSRGQYSHASITTEPRAIRDDAWLDDDWTSQFGFRGPASGSSGRPHPPICGFECRKESKSVFQRVAKAMIPMLAIILAVYGWIFHEAFCYGGGCDFTTGFCHTKCWMTISAGGMVLLLNIVLLFIILSDNPCACAKSMVCCCGCCVTESCSCDCDVMEYFKVMPVIHRIELTGERIETTFKKYSDSPLPFFLKDRLKRARLTTKPMPHEATDHNEHVINMRNDVTFPIDASKDYAMKRETHIDVRFVDKQGHRAKPGKRTTQIRANLVRGDGQNAVRIAPLDLSRGLRSGERLQMKTPIAKKRARQAELDLTFDLNKDIQNVADFGDARDSTGSGDASQHVPLCLELEWDTSVYNPRVLACSTENVGEGSHDFAAANIFEDDHNIGGEAAADVKQWQAGDDADETATQWFILDLGVEVALEYICFRKGRGAGTVLPERFTLLPTSRRRINMASQRAQDSLKELKRSKDGTGYAAGSHSAEDNRKPWEEGKKLARELYAIMDEFFDEYQERAKPSRMELFRTRVKQLSVSLPLPNDSNDDDDQGREDASCQRWRDWWHRVEDLYGYAHLTWSKDGKEEDEIPWDTHMDFARNKPWWLRVAQSRKKSADADEVSTTNEKSKATMQTHYGSDVEAQSRNESTGSDETSAIEDESKSTMQTYCGGNTEGATKVAGAVDDNKGLNLSEWCRCQAKSQRRKSAQFWLLELTAKKRDMKKMREDFDKYDVNKDGEISRDELHTFLEQKMRADFGVDRNQISEKLRKEMKRTIDASLARAKGKDSLSFEDFRRCVNLRLCLGSLEIEGRSHAGQVHKQRPKQRRFQMRVTDDKDLTVAQTQDILAKEREEKAQAQLFAAMRKGFGDIDTRLNRVDEKLGAIYQKTIDSYNIARELVTKEVDCPSLFYVYSREPPKSRLGRLYGHVKSMFEKECMLMLVCPHTHQAVECGPNGTGFKIKRPSDAMKKWAPAIKTALLVLHAATVAGKCVGLPLPVLPSSVGKNGGMLGLTDTDLEGDNCSAVEIAKEQGKQLLEVFSAIEGVERDEDEDDDDDDDDDMGFKDARDKLSQWMQKGQAGQDMAEYVESDIIRGEAGKKLRKATGDAYRKLNEFISQQDPHKQMLGLTRVTFLDGTEWISPAAVTDWKKCALKRRYEKLDASDRESFRTTYLVDAVDADPDRDCLLHYFDSEVASNQSFVLRIEIAAASLEDARKKAKATFGATCGAHVADPVERSLDNMHKYGGPPLELQCPDFNAATTDAMYVHLGVSSSRGFSATCVVPLAEIPRTTTKPQTKTYELLPAPGGKALKHANTIDAAIWLAADCGDGGGGSGGSR